MDLVLKTLETNTSRASLILRLVVGLVILPHGAQKLFGWFGGYGFSGTMGYFTDQMQLPVFIAFLVIMGESFGALTLMAGFFTGFAALSLSVIMVGAIALSHWDNGFFMNWFSQQSGEGFEYHLFIIAICMALTPNGGGLWSVDQMITAKLAPSGK